MSDSAMTAYQLLTILRQRLEQRIDAEQFRILNIEGSENNGLLCDDLKKIIDESMFNKDYGNQQ